MHYADYEQWLKREHSLIALDPKWVEVGPFLTPTISPNKPPWQMEWAIIFDDGLFFRVTENWFKRKSLGGRGLRYHHSFHYGPANPQRSTEGIPNRSPAYPAIIRVDVDRRGPHLHYGGNDHVPQSKVHGLDISNADPFIFAKAIIEHRQTGKDLAAIMKFTVTP